MSLPIGFAVGVHDDVDWLKHERIFLGGSPLRVVRVASRIANLMRDGELRVTDNDTELVADRG